MRWLTFIGVPAANQSPGSRPLSSEQIALLIAAGADNGHLFLFKSDEEQPFIISGRHQFRDPADRAIAVIHLEALKTLIRRGLFELDEGRLYNLTGSGFMKARELKRLRDSIEVDET